MRKLFKKAEIYGSLASVYHGSFAPPEEFENFWKLGKYKTSPESNMYGSGLYCIYKKTGSTQTERGEYGTYIYKFIVNISNYLIFDEKVFNKVYPKDANLSYKEKLNLQFKKFNIAWTDAIKEGYLDVSESRMAAEIKNKGSHHGLIFNHKNVGPVCVIFTPYSARLVGYSSGGQEVEFSMEKIKEVNVSKKPILNEIESDRNFVENLVKKYLENDYKDYGILFDSNLEYYKKYKKAPWMQKAVEKLALERWQQFIDLGLHKIDEYKNIYKNIALPYAEKLVHEENLNFLFHDFHKLYPDLTKKLAEKLSISNPWMFLVDFDKFKLALDPTYAEELKQIAETNLKTASSKSRRFNKIARYLKLTKIG